MDLIDRLERGFAALNAALRAQDSDAIIHAAAVIRALVREVEEPGVLPKNGGHPDRLAGLSKLIEESRLRVNNLTHLNRQPAIKLTSKSNAAVSMADEKARKTGDIGIFFPG